MDGLNLKDQAGIYWVDEGRLAAGRHPNLLAFSATAEALRALIEAGFNSFVDLTQEGEFSFGEYSQRAARLSTGQPEPVTYRRFPIPDMQVPTRELMADLLDYLEAELGSGKCVYLHCQAGWGRTGTAIGCYLSGHGFPGRLALEQLEKIRRLHGETAKSPESSQQRRFVETWQSPDS